MKQSPTFARGGKLASAGGSPQINADMRELVRWMRVDNPRWGAPGIHGELLRLGLERLFASRPDADCHQNRADHHAGTHRADQQNCLGSSFGDLPCDRSPAVTGRSILNHGGYRASETKRHGFPSLAG